MKHKDLFASYEAAWDCYENVIIPNFGATHLPWGFGIWLWLDAVEPDDDSAIVREWTAMKDAGILTNAGLKKLDRYAKEAAR